MKQLVQKICKVLSLTRFDAEMIASRLLDLPKHEIYLNTTYTDNARTKLESWLIKLKHGMPIEYITKKANFLDLDLCITPGVFIPRLETEFMVEMVKSRSRQTPRKIIEVGTGTGAISIALAGVFPDSSIIATDISEKALTCARYNIYKYHKDAQISLCRSDLLNGLSSTCDLIISNPPYVKSARLRKLPKSVRDFEPLIALDGGRHGIDAITRIIMKGYNMIVTHGTIALEIDDDQIDLIAGLLRYQHIKDYTFIKDLFGRFRYLFINKT